MYQETETMPLRVSFEGVNFEDSNQSEQAYRLTGPFFNFLMGLGDASVSGSLPEDGPALVFANHIDWSDVFVMHGLPIATARRTQRLVARRSLIDYEVVDSQKAKERRKVNDDGNKDYKDLSLLRKLKRRIGAYYMSQFNTLMVDIGSKDTKGFITEVMGELKADHLVSIFFQGTRRPRLDLLDDLEGAAILLARYLPQAESDGKRIPSYPVGISGTNGHPFRRIRVNIGEPFYHTDIPKVEGLSRLESARKLIRDRVGELIEDPKMKPAWELHRRGVPREVIEQAYMRDPDLVSLVELLDNTPFDFRSPTEIIEEIDTHAIFA